MRLARLIFAPSAIVDIVFGEADPPTCCLNQKRHRTQNSFVALEGEQGNGRLGPGQFAQAAQRAVQTN
jgi:hypothetical protein